MASDIVHLHHGRVDRRRPGPQADGAFPGRLIQLTPRAPSGYTATRRITYFIFINFASAMDASADNYGPHILVIDDDPATRRMVTRYFEEHDIPASSAAGRQDFGRQLQLREPSLILLDLRLGQDDGLDLLREIRSSSDVPVIITTGHRLDEVDRVVGLELGADDYVTKPFGLRELLARVRAVLRRHELGRLARAREPQRGGYKFGSWRLERDADKG